MDGTFDACLEAGAEVEVATRSRRLRADCLQKAFGPQATVHLADTDWASAWLLVEGNQAIRHHGAVGRPRRRGVGEPGRPSRHLLPQRLGLTSEAKKPDGKVNGVGSAGSGGAG